MKGRRGFSNAPAFSRVPCRPRASADAARPAPMKGGGRVRLRHLLAVLLICASHAAGQLQAGQGESGRAGGGAACCAIRRLGYPFGQRADLAREVRYALLDTCPDRRVPAARPMLEVEVDGRRRLAEFDVVRFFEDREEAEDYARENGVSDFKAEAGDYRVLPQLRPVVNFLEAVESGDFKLYRSTFDYDWKPRHLRSPTFWADLRRRQADRLREKFGADYSPAELDFTFTPSDTSGRRGSVGVTHRGRTFDDFLRVFFNEEAREWKIDELGY